MCFNHSINVVRAKNRFAVGKVFTAVDLVILQTGVNLNQARLDLSEFAILADVRWCAWVAWLFVREEVCTDALVSVVSTSSDKLACVSD